MNRNQFLDHSKEDQKIILSHNRFLNKQSNDGFTILKLAIKADRQNLVKSLIDSKVDLNFYDKKTKSTPLHFAIVEEKSFELLRMLVKSGARIHHTNGPDATWSPLFYCIHHAKLHVLKEILPMAKLKGQHLFTMDYDDPISYCLQQMEHQFFAQIGRQDGKVKLNSMTHILQTLID